VPTKGFGKEKWNCKEKVLRKEKWNGKEKAVALFL